MFETAGTKVLHDPWAARDAYIDVVLGRVPVEAFAAEHVSGDLVQALTLLEDEWSAFA